jgi:hypothetical protein
VITCSFLFPVIFFYTHRCQRSFNNSHIYEIILYLRRIFIIIASVLFCGQKEFLQNGQNFFSCTKKNDSLFKRILLHIFFYQAFLILTYYYDDIYIYYILIYIFVHYCLIYQVLINF